MSMRVFYALTTIDPIIVSQSAATTNNHQGLDYIPGSAMLGLVASRLYSELTDENSWQLFHSGKVQFSPAYPVVEQQVSLPIPASWHFAKGDAMTENGSINPMLLNQALDFTRDENVQYKQCRQGYVTANGAVATVKQGVVTKTALDRQTGSVKEGSLFLYSYLDAKQTFMGWIDCGSEDEKSRIETVLAGTHRLGRSRGSEFGRVKIECIEAPQWPESQPIKNRLVLWCVSDCQCVNQWGIPTYTPELTDLVPGTNGRLNTAQSFIRTTTVSRFNQKRQGFDSEQALIAKGSVLVFDEVRISDEQLNALGSKGIGINRQQGLGWVMVNPAWASKATLATDALFSPIACHHVVKQKNVAAVNTPLMAWVTRQQHLKHSVVDNIEKAKSVFSALMSDLQTARAYNHVAESYEFGPSSTQWRRIADVLRHNSDDATWKIALFDTKHGICKTEGDDFGWGIAWDNGNGFVNFSERFKTHIALMTVAQMRELLEMLCRYDISQSYGVRQASIELNIPLVSKERIE
ncbi:RAMP superfamily CRISPR-associated protein [Photobacterium leiognathi subsp. mandapamensis]|uniref:RAMP superfamily CRISPR-associated protein n=1 Tax=Photobacterium leiognathi TaxID=553611 RepID=UPI003AF36019